MKEKTEVSKTSLKLDTVVTITVFGADGNVIDSAFEEIDRLADLLDVNRPGSDVARLSEAAGVGWVSISEETAEVLEIAQKYYELSGGLFDVTAAPLIDLWDINNGGHYPSDEELSAALALVDGSALHVEGNRACLDRAGMKVSLGAVAKGYIADKVRDYLVSEGVSRAVINLGGNVVLLGGKDDGAPYKVGIQDPFGESGDVIRYIDAADETLVSSGVYERYFEHDGKRFHHILNPFTGMPAESGICGVTVISDSSADADALSTVCLLMGAEKGAELVESIPGTEAVFIADSGELVTTGALDERLRE